MYQYKISAGTKSKLTIKVNSCLQCNKTAVLQMIHSAVYFLQNWCSILDWLSSFATFFITFNHMTGRIQIPWADAGLCSAWVQQALFHVWRQWCQEANSPTWSSSPQRLLQVTGSVPAVANDTSIKVSLSKTSAVLTRISSEPSPSLLRGRWSRSAGWTGLGSSWETEQSFRCRFGWLTRRAACSPVPRNASGINSSTSSSARSGPFHTQTK